MTDIKAFAGKGTNKELRVAEYLELNYGGKAENWAHIKGHGYVHNSGGIEKANIHWFEETKTRYIREMFVKGWSKK